MIAVVAKVVPGSGGGRSNGNINNSTGNRSSGGSGSSHNNNNRGLQNRLEEAHQSPAERLPEAWGELGGPQGAHGARRNSFS